MDPIRTFVASGAPNLSHSFFHSRTPVSASLKAFNHGCVSKTPCKKVITVTDTHTNQKYKYTVVRKNNPHVVKLDGVPVKFRFSATAKSLLHPHKSTKKTISKKTISKKTKKPKKSLRSCVKKCIQKY